MRNSLVIFFASLFIAACSLSTGPSPANNFPATQTARAVETLEWTGVDVPEALAGTHWELEKLEGRDLIPGTHITLTFESKELSGNAGCNDYTTTFLNSPGNNFGTGITVITVMLYSHIPPAEITEQEDSYMDVLGRVRDFELSENRLVLKDVGGNIVLEYQSSE